MTILNVLLIAGAIAASQPFLVLGQTSLESITSPPVPPGIQVPAGNVAYMKGQASGTQNYVCLPSGAGVRWTFIAPQATLFFTYKFLNTEIRQQITTHFLSANPQENGTPRPTWQSSLDTSSIWAKAVASSSDPAFVETDSIPWLLLEVVGRQRGPWGGSSLNTTTFIQRLNTSGGIAPSSGCSESTDIGKLWLVPYAADYYLYTASGRR